MDELKTMPLKFRVWDKQRKDFVNWGGETELNLWMLADWMSQLNVAEFYEDFVVSQDTGLVSRDGKHLFTGDIVRCIGEDTYALHQGEISVVQCFKDVACCGLQLGDKRMAIRGDDLEHIGNIWGNPDLLKEEK